MFFKFFVSWGTKKKKKKKKDFPGGSVGKESSCNADQV